MSTRISNTHNYRRRLLIQNLLMLTLVTGFLGMAATRLQLRTPKSQPQVVAQKTTSHGSYFKTLGEKFTRPYVATWKQFTSSHAAVAASAELPVIENSKISTNPFSVSPLSILLSWNFY